MVQVMRSEFHSAGCSAECSPVTTAHVLALAAANKDSSGTSPNEERCEDSVVEVRTLESEIAARDLSAAAAEKTAAAEAASALAELTAAAELDPTQVEVEATMRECQRLATELASKQLHVARLREELREAQRSSEAFHETVTLACFDEVQRATDRNLELEEMLEQLNAIPQASPYQPLLSTSR